MSKRYVNGMFLVGLLMAGSEVWKQFVLTNQIYGGHYNVWYVPFQLCSVPMYLCILMRFVSEPTRQRIRMFLMTFSLLGGVAAFFDTTGMHYLVSALTVHSYVWHIGLIGIGVWSGIEWCKERDVITKFGACMPTKFWDCIPIWLVCVIIATILNIVLHPFGEINMFYISPYEPSQQVIVRDVVAKIGILPSNVLYLLAMLMAAYVIYRIWVSIGRRFYSL